MKNQTPLFYGWWIVVACVCILAVGGPASVAVANVYQLPISQEFNITASEFAIVNAIVLGTGIFASPVAAKLYATRNFKKIFTFSVLLYGFSYAAYGLAPNIYVFYALSVLVGIGFSASTILPVGILINRWFVEKRGLATSIAFSGLGVGGVIFSQLVTWSINQWGWRWTYILYALLIMIVCIPLIQWVIVDYPATKGLKPLGASSRMQSDSGEVEQRGYVSMAMRETYTKPFFIFLILGCITLGIVNNAGLGQFPPYLQQLHGASLAATAIGVYSAVGIFGKLFIGMLSDKKGLIVSIVYGILMLALTFILMIYAKEYIIAVIASICFGLGNAMGSVLSPLMTSSIYSHEDYEQAYGFVTSSTNIGMMIGSIFAASIADITGTYVYAWMINAVLCVVAGILWIASFKNSRRYL